MEQEEKSKMSDKKTNKQNMAAESILGRMSLEDKIALCEGASFWKTKAFEKYGIPAMFLCDGPHGLRKQEKEGRADMLGVNESRKSTCFPAEVTTASSWDPELAEKIGKAVGEEALEQGVNVVLGPGANIKRNPLCGRNFEYFSEDPVLSGEMAAGFIKGVETNGVGSSLKHFAANSQEKSRFNSNSVMDERTLRELYLSAFETAVKKGHPSTVMCAYPKLNGIHCSDNKKLLSEILRDEWGFEGVVVTDWGAMNDRIEGFKAGCDLNMPGGSDYMRKDCVRAVQNGTLSEKDIDNCAGRIIKLALSTDITRKKYDSERRKMAEEETLYTDHDKLACEAAEQGAVLLKNEEHILPLSEKEKVAVIGYMAHDMRYQGAGSSHINASQVSQPDSYLKNAIFTDGCDEKGYTTDERIADVRKTALEADKVVVFAGLPGNYESEGFDRMDMRMPEGENRMIEAAAAANANTVVVLLCGSVVECPWADKVKGILYMGLPGQAGGRAIANLLYGRVSPSGRLAETWPVRYEDCPSSSFYGKEKDALYLEGIYSGYRYYQKAPTKVRWAFGYGLSYTEFSYSKLRIEKIQKEAGSPLFRASLHVCNAGEVKGAETIQVYIEMPQDGIHRPIRQLRHFKKVRLEPGEEREVAFILDHRDFAIWQNGWTIPSGSYMIAVGKNCEEICLREQIALEGEAVTAPVWQKESWYQTCAGVPEEKDLESALGGKIYTETPAKGSFTMDNTVIEMKDSSLLMKILYKAIEFTVAKGFGGKKDYENPEFRMLMASSAGSPLRSIQISGGIRGGLMKGLLEMANGHFFRGIREIIRG